MGYTHYFPHKKVSKSVWTDILAGCKRAYALLPKNIKITGGSGYGAKPLFGEDEILFNGDAEEDLAHETFALYRESGGGFAFCKTAQKPYDVLVVACLLIYHHFSPSTIEISTDGDKGDWEAGHALAERALGLPVAYPKIEHWPAENENK